MSRRRARPRWRRHVARLVPTRPARGRPGRAEPPWPARGSPVDPAGRPAAARRGRKTGGATGAGLGLYQSTYYTLLYRGFGETSAAKPSMMSGYTLPWRRWPYAADDGLGSAVSGAGPGS